ncbi:MAG TPA: hypothetical protein ENI29_19685 [bacterium]|nr:hypothetical protein [bacterium]
MTILENEFDYIEEIKSKKKVEDEDDLTQEHDLRNSTIKIKRKKTSLDISITKEDITSIKGVGARVAEKLKGANLTTIVGIASATVERLSEINGIGKATAGKIIEGAKAITDRKNLQDFATSKRILSEQIKDNEDDNKKNIITKKLTEEKEVVPTQELEEKGTSVQEFKPWFHPKFKIKRSNRQISPERKKNIKVRSHKAVKVKVPNKTIATHENSIEAEIINDYEMEDFEVEEEMVENEVENYPVQRETIPVNVEKHILEVEEKSKIEPQKKTTPDEKINPHEKAVILSRIAKTLRTQGYYILKKHSSMKDLFAHVDLMALKSVPVNEVLEFIIFVPLKVSVLKGKVQISNEVIKYISTNENFKKKGSVFKKLINSYFGSLEESHELIKEELEKGTLLSSVNRCLKQDISLKTSITKKNLFFSAGLQQFKMLVEPMLVCKGEVGFLEKITPFAYLKDINLHILAEDKLAELLQFIERKYTLLEKHKTKETSLLPYYETYNQFLKRSELFSIPLIGFAFGLLTILGLQSFQMLGLFLNIGYGLLGIYFITLVFFYMKFFKIKLEVQADFKTPYYKKMPKLDETSLVLISEEFESELMSQFVYECVDSDTDLQIISNIEEDQISERFHRKRLEKTVKNNGFYEDGANPEPIKLNSKKLIKQEKKHNSFNNKIGSFLED